MRKVRQAELILVPIFSSEKLQTLPAGLARGAAQASRALPERVMHCALRRPVMPTIRRTKQDSRGPGLSLSGINARLSLAEGVFGSQTRNVLLPSWSDYRESSVCAKSVTRPRTDAPLARTSCFAYI